MIPVGYDVILFVAISELIVGTSGQFQSLTVVLFIVQNCTMHVNNSTSIYMYEAIKSVTAYRV